MKIKTSELIGLALNYVVAKIEGHESRCPWMLEQEGYTKWQSYERGWGYPIPGYCGEWRCGGPIIEREQISIVYDDAAWRADPDMMEAVSQRQWGETPLIAAMRCYVASKLGDEVDIPEELK